MANFKPQRTLLLTIPTVALMAALNGCGGGGSADAAPDVAPVIARANKNPHGTSTTSTGTTTTTTTATAPTSTSGTTTTTSGTTTTTSGTTTTTSGTTTSTSGATSTATATPTTLPVYTDGASRVNALLAANLNVAIPAGVYLINTELSVRDGQVIAPATGAQVILKAAPGYTGRMISTVDQNVTVRGLTFDGSYADRLSLEGNASANLINIVGSSNVVLEDNTFQYAPAYAIWSYRSAQLQIRANKFIECWEPIRIDANNLAGGTIDSNTFTNTAAFKSIQHIDAMNTVGLTVSNNTMSGAGLAEPSSHGYEGTWGNSIYIFNSSGYLVTGNTTSGNHWSGMVSGQYTTSSTIRGNTFGDGVGTSAALWVEQVGTTSITVDTNQLDGGLSMGDTGGDYITVKNNTIRSRSVGIDVNFAAKHVTFSGNTVTSKAATRTDNGVYLWSKNTPDVAISLSSNSFSGFNNGIAINNDAGLGTVYGISLSGNTFSNNNVNIWVPSTITLNQPLGQ
jgi:hypothetical protein